MAALGRLAVLAGLMACILGVVTIAHGLRRRSPTALRSGARYAVATLVAAVVAVAAMEVALLRDDFSLEYVATHSATTTPLPYKIATLWAALEGSILLWLLVLTGYIGAVVWWFRGRLGDRLVAWALLTMLAVAGFFFFLVAGPADPFATLADPPLDGPGPNPLLQNHPLMVVHPVLLYVGYVGFTVPFAFAVAALVTGRLGEGWLAQTRVWTMIAWGSLTTGIVLGAWWSYEVLGWGGYWAWDPVENASFLPWLTGTAFIHSVMVQERRGMLRLWNLSLLLATFALTILGTFLTRSGVLDSVHEFTESAIGPLLLGFFVVVVALSLGLIFWRADRLRSPGAIGSSLSREAAFLGNNLLFTGFAFVVLLGTVFPLLVEALRDDRIAVGSPYFERMTLPIGLALLALMGLSILVPWRAGSLGQLRERALLPAWVGGLVALAAALLGADGVVPLIAFGLAGFTGAASLRQIGRAVRRQGIVAGLTGRTSGGMVVHLGVVALAVGLVASQSYSTEQEVRLEEGQSASVAGHTITFQGLEASAEVGGREVTKAAVRLDGELHHPAVTRFPSFGAPIGTPSVDTTLTRDVYVTLLDPGQEPGDPVVLRVIVRPLVVWLWIGGALMAVGTLLAIVPVRRRARHFLQAAAGGPGADRPGTDGFGTETVEDRQEQPEQPATVGST
jgi:cytochrome c-type biogenesis protein CcmF